MFIEESCRKKARLYFDFEQKHMGHALDIEFEHVSKDKMTALMPVNENTIQPFGVLHGGASVVLSETLCSVGGWFNLDDISQKSVVGIEINANHIRAVHKGGKVRGTATPVKIGKKVQVWECVITDEKGRKVSVSRCTLAVIPLS